MSEHKTAAEVLAEIRSDPDGPMAQAVRRAVDASVKFQREWDTMMRDHGMVSEWGEGRPVGYYPDEVAGDV